MRKLDRTSRPLLHEEEICVSINIPRKGVWFILFFCNFLSKTPARLFDNNNNTFAVKVGCVARHLGNCLDWFWVILDKELRPRLSSLNK